MAWAMRQIGLLWEEVLWISVGTIMALFQADSPFPFHNIFTVCLVSLWGKATVAILKDLYLHTGVVLAIPTWDMKQLTLKMVCSSPQKLFLPDIQGHQLPVDGVTVTGMKDQGLLVRDTNHFLMQQTPMLKWSLRYQLIVRQNLVNPFVTHGCRVEVTRFMSPSLDTYKPRTDIIGSQGQDVSPFYIFKTPDYRIRCYWVKT